MTTAASKFAGYQGVDVVQPQPGGDAGWRVLVHFATEEELRHWRSSSTARRWQARADALTLGAPRIERVNGLETWFTLPTRDASPPPKWKTAIISAIGIYPLLLTVPPLLGTVTEGLPAWAGTIVSVIVMSPLITWVVMPAVSRIFRPFL